MRAIVVDHFMEPSDLVVSEIAEPAVHSGMLVVDVVAAGCNFFDILLVQGKYQLKPSFPFTPGAEVAGVVREVGGDVEGFAVGDRVMASLPYGAFAERVLVPAFTASKIPAALDFAEAAAFPIVYPTSYAALVFRGQVKAGETVLVTAAAGGVGTSSVQLAKLLGARVIGLARGADKLEVVRSIGADVAIDYSSPGWVDEVRAATGGRGVDVVVENVGGEIFDGAVKCLAWGGRLVVVGFAGGTIPEIKVNRILLKHIAIVGLHWGPMVQHEPDKARESARQLAEWVNAGRLKPVVWKRFPMSEAPAALAALGSRQVHGKVVLDVAT